jgi:hypothetical protein
MAKIKRSTARAIVCDALSGVTTAIPDTAASEDIEIGQALRDLYKQSHKALFRVHDDIIQQVHDAGFWVDLTPAELADPNFDTVGELVTLIVETSEKLTP